MIRRVIFPDWEDFPLWHAVRTPFGTHDEKLEKKVEHREKVHLPAS